MNVRSLTLFVVLPLVGCGSGGGSALPVTGSGTDDAGVASRNVGGSSGSIGTGSADQGSAGTSTAFPVIAYPTCSGTEWSWGTDPYGLGYGPDAMVVAQSSPGHFVVTLTDEVSGGTSSLDFTAASASTALVDSNQTVVSSAVPAPQKAAMDSPITISVSSAEVSTDNGWTYFDLVGTSDTLLVSYSISCPVPGANTSPPPLAVTADATLAGTYTTCRQTVGPAGTLTDGDVELAVSGSTITATLSLDTFAQGTVDFTADSRTTAVLAQDQEGGRLESSFCGSSGDGAAVPLTGASLVVDKGILYMSLAGSSACGADATLQVVCTGSSLR